MRGELITMMMMATIVGMGMTCQGAVNALLTRRIDHPLQAALFSFCVGTFTLIIVSACLRIPFPSISTIRTMPWYLWTGGLLGAIFVTTMTIVTPQLGSAVTISCVVTGQIVASMILDHYGALGLPVTPFSLQRLLGMVLLIVAVVLIRR